MLSLAVRELLNAEADGEPGRLCELRARFAGVAVPGSAVTLRLLGRQEQDGHTGSCFDVLAANGHEVV